MACLFDLCISDALTGNTSVIKDSAVNKASKSVSHSKAPAPSASCLHYLEVAYLSPCRGSTSVDIETHSLVGPSSEDDSASLASKSNESLTNSGLGARSLPKGCVNARIYSMKHGAKNKVAAEATMSF